MTAKKNISKALNIILWIIQVLMCLTLVWGAYMKIFTPQSQLADLWPWMAEVSPAFLYTTAIIDLLGGLGLVLPGLLKIRPALTFFAALGVVALMVSAIVFHVSRGEAEGIGFNIVFGVFAGFVCWGRR